MDLDNNELTHLPRGINTMINLQTLLVDFNKDHLTRLKFILDLWEVKF